MFKGQASYYCLSYVIQRGNSILCFFIQFYYCIYHRLRLWKDNTGLISPT